MRWEYRQLEVKTSGFLTSRLPDGWLAELNLLGEEGWEVCQAVPLARGFGRTDYVCFLLRRRAKPR